MQERFRPALGELGSHLVLGSLLNALRARWGTYEVVDHFQQGEFHHDVVLRLPKTARELPGAYLVVATNCNGGVKELLCFNEAPTHGALWKARCPANPEFEGTLPPVLGRITTHHYFDPAELLKPDARSEYRPEFRMRQRGGGWMVKAPARCGT